jgi:hypothetical protein
MNIKTHLKVIISILSLVAVSFFWKYMQEQYEYFGFYMLSGVLMIFGYILLYLAFSPKDDDNSRDRYF